ncbi:hypothetical protein SAMN05444678_11827 [Sphingomonas sp. YR710]|uniref:alpha/beta fold hydrolase n=1 Tax=Sphingomonas sp. YR710 TaxID=1882773 RepID=UPI0008874606|nr:alpha/beta hydrolase [Sphingomonas sp. YR710]SDD65052.1 hypothetical protein SAMN05444678_11827 [Sphingomonas sp. YR710]
MIVDSLPFLGLLRGPQATVEAITPAAEAMRAKIMGATQEAFAASEGPMMARMIKSKNAHAQQALAAASASDHRVVAQALYDDMTTDARPGLPSITAPVTILYPWDEASGIPQPIGDSFYQSAFAAVPHATFKRIDGSRHFIMIDQPEAFQVAVDGFLKP